MKVLNFSNIIKYRLYIIIAVSSILGLLLISFAFYTVFKGSNIKEYPTQNIFNLNSYYAKYNVTVNSNKTSNSYIVEEWYENSDGTPKFRFNYKDFMQNDYSIIISGDKVKIQNSLQISRYVSTIKNTKKENLYSLATYIDIINDNCFRINVDTTEVTTTYTIYVKEKTNDVADGYSEILSSSLNIEKVQLYLVANMPKSIKIISKDKEEIVIEYLEFIQNLDVDSSLFEV